MALHARTKGDGTMVTFKDSIIFENYTQLFEFICGMDGEIQSRTVLKGDFQVEGDCWRFVSYSPDKAGASHNIDPNSGECYEERLGVLEICTGNYRYTRYVPITADTDMEEMKKKWLHAYCRFHGFALAETFDEGQNFKPSVEIRGVVPSADTLEAEGMGGAL
jgi:hypothetical protein